ncbi:MAG: hypothetical protein LBJ31_09435 [Treponema sp.]|jgi:acetylornithine deacetylase/succinyl-diaminopimelate desuccinylase-like protein|nr:hypothetical protein [Treponema sp.]
MRPPETSSGSGIIAALLKTLSDRVSKLFHPFFRAAPRFPLADRLLADALRLCAIPSPAGREEERAEFITERLRSLLIPFFIDEAGNILVRAAAILDEDLSAEPLLVFTRMGSERWNPLESLGRVDMEYARGAGLADVLGSAALLSLIEAYAGGRLVTGRDIIFFFSALSFDDPQSDAFKTINEEKKRPAAAVGVQGFSLGTLTSHSLGSYRAQIILSEDSQNENENTLVNTLLQLAEKVQETACDVSVYINRIEALSSWGRTPREAELDMELESDDKEKLDAVIEKIAAVTESFSPVKTRRKAGKITGTFKLLSSTPPGDPEVSAGLVQTLRVLMKELRIKAAEDARPDPSSFLSALGIPAISVGIAQGREALNYDKVEIASIEKGRMLLEKLLKLLGA